MTMTDSLRGYAGGIQAAHNVAAATLYPLGFVTKVTYKDDRKFLIPEYKRNAPDEEGDPIPTTSEASGTIEFNLDNQGEWMIYVTSVWGMPSISGTTKTFTLQNTPEELTLIFEYGDSAAFIRVTNVRITNIAWKGVPANIIGGTATWVGIAEEPVASPPTLDYSTLPAGANPFTSDQAVATRGSTAGYCTDNWEVQWMRTAPPHYCATAASAPTSTTPRGSKPDRFKNGKWSGRFNVQYVYTGDSGSGFYNFRHGITEPWDFSFTDPQTQAALSLAYLPTCHFTIPRYAMNETDLGWDQEDVVNICKGIISRDPSTGRGTIVGINGHALARS